MFDTDVLADLDPTFPLLATYSDLVPNPGELRAKFPHSQIILIDRALDDPSGQASVRDVETHADSIAGCADWYDRKLAAGVKYLTMYHDRADTAAILANLAGRKAFHWIATLDGTLHITGFSPLRTPAAVQCLDAAHVGRHGDLSLVFEDAWHPAAAPAQLADALAKAIHARADVGHAAGLLAEVIGDLKIGA